MSDSLGGQSDYSELDRLSDDEFAELYPTVAEPNLRLGVENAGPAQGVAQQVVAINNVLIQQTS